MDECALDGCEKPGKPCRIDLGGEDLYREKASLDLYFWRFMAKLFLSYSHQDEEFRKQLETHLALLRRQGVIDIWHDRRIEAGQNIHSSIDQNIEDSEVILLLVSADFLASDYCYDIEMRRAIKRHEEGVARVIPVILRPCDWHSAPFGNLRATPQDGKPVSKFADRDEAYLIIVRDIRQAVGGIGKQENRSPAQQVPPEASVFVRPNRSSNLRVQREPSDREKDRFVTDSFEYVSNYFENSLRELETRNPDVEIEFRRIDANHFSAAIYRRGQIASQCKIWIGGMFSSQSISYSVNRSGDDHSLNESVSLNSDGYSLAFRPMMGISFSQSPDQRRLSQEGVAEYYWSKLIEPLQRGR
jgi:hypothetical protein